MVSSPAVRPSFARVLIICAVLTVSQSLAQQQQAAPPKPLPMDAVDSLTAPIALYPDALIAQILMASTNVKALQSFSAWLTINSGLKGSELQEAAEKAGYGPSYIALAVFPQVVQMMVQKIDWTTQLGQAFTNDKDGVFASIQRLRLKAQSAGNLETTPQQQVETQKTSSGEQVIVIQPTNPQVVYVPQYNPQTVYVTQPAPAPSAASVGVAAAIGFTAGIIIGASSNNYYYGPYGWHGGAMYHEAWEDRYDYLEERQENRLEYRENRQENFQENAPQRQANQEQRRSTAQANQAQRQSTAQANQAQRQSTAQANQAQRQSTAQANQAQRQANQAERQSTAQANQAQRQSSMQDRQGQVQANQGQRQASARPAQSSGQWQSQRSTAAATSSYGGQGASQRSGGFSGYQSGSATRSERSRGSSSLSSSRGGGGGRRRR
jgi:uncharacterized protein DUF3300